MVHYSKLISFHVSPASSPRCTPKLSKDKTTTCSSMELFFMNSFAALEISPCRRYVVVKATAEFAVCRLTLKLLLFYSCLDFTQNLEKTHLSRRLLPMRHSQSFLLFCFAFQIFHELLSQISHLTFYVQFQLGFTFMCQHSF